MSFVKFTCKVIRVKFIIVATFVILCHLYMTFLVNVSSLSCSRGLSHTHGHAQEHKKLAFIYLQVRGVLPLILNAQNHLK